MTHEETIKILAVLKRGYPNFYNGMEKDDLDGIVALWETIFLDDTYSVVSAAVIAQIAANPSSYPPSIGTIKDAVAKLTTPQEMSEMEAWGYVERALRNSCYNSISEFAKLPEDVQHVVGSPRQLQEWATMEIGTVQSVVQSNFMRSYRARAKSNREAACLPKAVKDMAAKLAGGMTLQLPGDREE